MQDVLLSSYLEVEALLIPHLHFYCLDSLRNIHIIFYVPPVQLWSGVYMYMDVNVIMEMNVIATTGFH